MQRGEQFSGSLSRRQFPGRAAGLGPGAAAAGGLLDETFRGEADRRMTRIFLEHHPWIVVIQPYEDYGLRRHVEFTPNPNQQFELRRFTFEMRRA